jgi:hypothetical protein
MPKSFRNKPEQTAFGLLPHLNTSRIIDAGRKVLSAMRYTKYFSHCW